MVGFDVVVVEVVVVGAGLVVATSRTRIDIQTYVRIFNPLEIKQYSKPVIQAECDIIMGSFTFLQA